MADIPLKTRGEKRALYTERDQKYAVENEDDDTTNTQENTNTLSRRLSSRGEFIKMRTVVIGIELLLGMVGVVIVIAETMLYENDRNHKSSDMSTILKSFVSASTLALLCALCFDYFIIIRIRMLKQNLANWDLAVDGCLVFRFVAEMVVCVVHPFPGDITFSAYLLPLGNYRTTYLDAILSVVVVFRLYLIVKFAAVVISTMNNSTVMNISALRQVKFNTMFVFKILLTKSPFLVIICILVVMNLSLAWMMNTCEIYFGDEDYYFNFSDSLWLVVITFLTVGYGDQTPGTYCGRGVSVCTGAMGLMTVALLAAVVFTRIQQSRSQKYVFNFLSRLSTDKKRKAAAADVVKAVVKTYNLTKRGVGINEKAVQRQRDLMKMAVKRMKEARHELERIEMSSMGIIEVSQQIDRMSVSVTKVKATQKEHSSRLLEVVPRLNAIEGSIQTIKQLLADKNT